MRKILNINSDWGFSKTLTEIPTGFDGLEMVNVPHCWNAVDGQDGGGDYYRGTCYYAKKIIKSELEKSDKCYLEINGANSQASVYLNGEHLRTHNGGYSTFRIDITDYLKDENLLVVAVDNSPNDYVYPQMADFTFYGGLYRDVNLIFVNESHFDLDFFGGPGITVTPELDGDNANVQIKSYISNKKEGQAVKYTILDKEGNVVANAEGVEATAVISNVIRWHGRKNPYLYTLKAELVEGDKVIDAITVRFGCRTFEIDPENGFILNGEEYPLRGVSRHQDRWGIGNALLKEHHKEDMDFICEVGATTIRLAHYQHDQYFYDLCDERGLVIWAEIPYISRHMATGRENTISQMKELIVQNYNHPSIVVWGLSNEITMNGADDPDLLENHYILNDLVHSMDKTRLTTMACISMVSMDEKYVHIPDVVSYNHYFGWYGGETSMNGPWFDKFHAKYPNKPIGCSEYGCEALNWHSSNPTQGDYTEEYQAYYHEELIKQLFTRKYIWATHVWNMFDFGADARAEGGENGQNHKGLMTFDRKYKKDAFYAYKAWLSDEPFVHICSKRYVDRVEDVVKITVYSNLPEVELFANGVSVGKVQAEDHFFRFEVKNEGETTLKAVAGDCVDESLIKKVDVFNEEYRLRESTTVLNWFDITEIEGRLSLNSKLSDITKTLRGKLALIPMLSKVMKSMGGKKGKKGGTKMKLSPEMKQMMMGFTLLRMTGLMTMVDVTFTKEELLKLNKKLNKIKLK